MIFDYAAIGAAVRSARKKMKISQDAAAKIAGVGRMTFIRYEKGVSGMTSSVLEKIGAALSIDFVGLPQVPPPSRLVFFCSHCGRRNIVEAVSHA